ncbi:hypothetical protein [Nonomuraea sp. NPDC049784]|uniref:hypothetical protein n=1 Tax=Nonomuraea sp. NPDC049784 TaxID=3154361 RepID=UPI0033F3B6B0
MALSTRAGPGGTCAALARFAVPFPIVVAAAALLGWLVHRLAPHVFKRGNGHDGDGGPAPSIPDDALGD